MSMYCENDSYIDEIYLENIRRKVDVIRESFFQL